MNYFEFKDRYLNVLFKLEDTTNQISHHISTNLYMINEDELYENCLLLNIIEFAHHKIKKLEGLVINAACISFEVAMLEIVEAICKVNCYLYSINARVEACAPKHAKTFKIMYHIYFEEAKYLFNRLGYVEATLLIVSSDKLLWEKRVGDFSNIKAKAMEQVTLIRNKDKCI